MNRTALDAINRGRNLLIRQAPFFGVLITFLGAPIERPDVGTMATDGAALYYAPEFVLSLPTRKLVGVLAHEAFHCALMHMTRLGGRDLALANRAADYAINGDLVRMGFELPDGALIDTRFNGMGFEEIYDVLAREQRQRSKAQDGNAGKPQAGQGQQGSAGQSQGQPSGDKPQSGQGQQGQQGQNGAPAGAAGQPGTDAGQGQQGQPAATHGPASGNGTPAGQGQPGASGDVANDNAATHGMGGIIRPGDGGTTAARETAERWQVWTRRAVATAKRQAGTVPGMFERIIEEANQPRESYRDAFADFINSRVAVDMQFSRPNRRYLHAGVILPGVVVDGLEHLVFIVDTSGSIDQHMIAVAADNVVGAAEEGKVQRLTVVFADVDVRAVQEFEHGDDIAGMLDAKGGGGTRFDKALAWVEENAPDATAIVYLTDLVVRSEHFGRDPGLPVLWAVHGDSRDYERRAAKVPFGECVYVGRLERPARKAA